jgi:hypothetical protein
VKYLIVAVLALTGVIAHAESGITCVEFTPAESVQNASVWNLPKELRAESIPLDLPTEGELIREFASKSVQDRLSGFLSAQRQSLMLFTVSATPPGGAQPVALFAAPFNAIGRLFVLDNAAERACTAFFFGDSMVVMTAAHCVFNRASGQFFSSIHFTRAHNPNGGQPFGIRKVAIVDEWKTSPTPHDFDYAFLHMTTALQSPKNPLTLGNLGAFHDWIAVGYPKDPTNPVFDGQTMMRAAGTLGTAPSANMIRMVGNPMGPGTSGGPFLPPAVPPQSLFGTQAISLGSMKRGPLIVDGPVLGKRTMDLFTNVKDVQGDCKK